MIDNQKWSSFHRPLVSLAIGGCAETCENGQYVSLQYRFYFDLLHKFRTSLLRYCLGPLVW
jgi:hypothetical protein